MDVDYDGRLHEVYRAARVLPESAVRQWMDAAAAHVHSPGPAIALDLGSGTGRFTPALAGTFGAAVGVEPSSGMRSVAGRVSTGAGVRYVGGRAEALPLAAGSSDLAWIFLVLHHVTDRAACARELARVLRPGAPVFVRSVFPERRIEALWQRFFPRTRTIEAEVMPTLAEIDEVFGAAGFEHVGVDVLDVELAASFAEYTERIAQRGISFLETLDDAEFDAGVAAMRAEASNEAVAHPVVESVDLLVLRRR